LRVAKLINGLNALGWHLYRGIREAAVYPLVLAYRASRQADTIRADVVRWCDMLAVPGHETVDPPVGESALRGYLASVTEFRNVFYYRLRAGGGSPATVAMICQLIWRPLPSFEINCASVGPGLFISHGYGAILTAERVGANCTIHQQVTVGWRTRQHQEHVSAGARPPILGDNVFLGTGAKVLGEITLGNNVTIGANAVVLCDVPDGFTAVGVPARLLPARPDTAGNGLSPGCRSGRQAPA
jgi:serine O-acetyltransferase